MNIRKTILLLFFAGFLSVNAQHAVVKWRTVEEVAKLVQTDPKPVFMDLYTDWCGWCKRMDAATFTNPAIVEYLNNDYYAIKFNAEGREPVQLGDQKFINEGAEQGRRGSHQLAIAILQGKMSYPTTAYFDEKFQLLTTVPGYKGPKDLEQILVWFQSGKYKTVAFEEFTKTFVGKVK